MSRWQVAQLYFSDPDARQAGNVQADLITHTPNLTLAAFPQDDLQAAGIQLPDLGWFQRFAVQLHTVLQPLERRCSDFSLYPYQVFLFDLAVLADQLARDAAILGHDQQAARVDVQASGRCKTL